MGLSAVRTHLEVLKPVLEEHLPTRNSQIGSCGAEGWEFYCVELLGHTTPWFRGTEPIPR